MTKLNFIKTIFAVLISTALANEVSSKAIYDSQTKILSLEDVLFPSIEEFTGKATENKGIFDIQLQETNKWVFELMPWSVNLKSMFDGENTSGYILYDHNSKSINIPCVEITSNDNETEGKYYKDMTMKLNGSYPIFHAQETIETDSCEISKAQLKDNLSNATVKIYRIEDNGDKTLLYEEQTDSSGSFYAHEDELDDDKFYIYEVSGGVDNKGTIRAISKGSWIKNKDFNVSLVSEIAYIFLAKDLKYDFDATKVQNRLNEVAKTIFSNDITGDGNINVDDLLTFDYQKNLNDINSSEFSSEKLEGIISDIYSGDFSYTNTIVTSIIDLELFTPISNKPKIEAPKTTNQSSVTAKIKAPVGSQIVLNGSNTGIIISESGEANITLDTSGAYGNKTFTIKFINIAGVESDEMNVTIEKKAVTSFLTSFAGAYKPDNNNVVEFVAQSDGLKPVDMTIKWDDNTIEKVEVPINGSKTITHTYNNNENKDIYMNGFVGVKNTKGKIQDVKRWGKDTKFVYMREMFKMYEKTDWSATDIPNTKYVTNMSYMFSGNRSGAKISLNPNIGDWDVSNVTDMTSMFYQNIGFNQDISNWDVSNVVTMNTMFQVAKSFNQDIGNWDVSNVTDMGSMFHVASSFNQDIGRWDVSKVTRMNSMLESTPFNHDIGSWDVSNVRDIHGIFWSARNFNQDISNWDVSNATNMSWMFQSASAFNQDISKWNVSNATNMYAMFRSAVSFNQDISKWNVSNVTDMALMFENASSFSNNDLSNWDVSKVSRRERFGNGWGSGNTEPNWR